MIGTYRSEDVEVMKITAASRNKSRLQELIEFARLSGFKRLGIASCKGVWDYALKLEAILRNVGFEVYNINCRESGLDFCHICDEMSGSCCDPLAQAEYLNKMATEMNIEFGLCLGHGLLFKKHSQAPVTTFLVKDFACEHNPALELCE